ncbi:hypothetical protein CBM2634_A90021 [Cupriavidus taiwanensis]|uniref:Uncharacterized protein n=1 Tax=Cupriavidus taiwanensis TaxID=164546 RepID=A0A375J3Z6_9BURK|nr:hypothetical protein CBM2634_A90021 [Cupriavidus taiwanensis]
MVLPLRLKSDMAHLPLPDRLAQLAGSILRRGSARGQSSRTSSACRPCGRAAPPPWPSSAPFRGGRPAAAPRCPGRSSCRGSSCGTVDRSELAPPRVRRAGAVGAIPHPAGGCASRSRDISLGVAAVVAAHGKLTKMIHTDFHHSVEFTVFLSQISRARWAFQYQVGGQPLRSGGEWCPNRAIAIEEATQLARRDIEALLSARVPQSR